MDLTFNSRMEAYYQKFIELQEKLRNSEEERLKLEMKFNEMVQVAKEEEQVHYKKLRAQYKRFLEEDRKRQERNERILRNLERIEARIAMLTSKTERFKMLRRQYQTYLQRISRDNSSERPGNPPPRILINKPYSSNVKSETSDEDAINKGSHKADDEKLKMLDKYLQSLSSQKLEDRTEQARKNLHADMKYLNDVSKKLEKGFDSNEANSIAEDIMNSIFSRHYRKEPHDQDLFQPIPKHSGVARKLVTDTNTKMFGDNFNIGRKISTAPDYTVPYNLQHTSNINDKLSNDSVELRNHGKDIKSTTHFDEKSFTPDEEIGEREDSNIDLTTNDVTSNVNNTVTRNIFNDDFNKPSVPYSRDSYMNEHDKNGIDAIKNSSQNSDIAKDKGNIPNLGKTSVINERDASVSEKNRGKKEKIDSKEDVENAENDFKLSKYEIDVSENEKHRNEDEDNVQERVFVGENKDEESEQVYYNEADETQDNNEDRVEQQPLCIENNQNNDEINISKEKMAEPMETATEEFKNVASPVITTLDKADEDSKVDTKQVNAELVNQEENSSQVNEGQEQVTTVSNQNKTEDQYDEFGEHNHLNLNEDGDTLQQQYENVQYNEGDDQNPYYEDSIQPTQQQYGEQGDNNQEYYDDGQAHVYDQQYDENQAQLYEESGETIQEYQTNGQEMNYPYQQQYDENGQPLYQYDENGQLIQQYDENGQPVDMYNQPLQYDGIEQQHGNVQPAEGYENMQQYATDGQEFQQYDENGQPIYQYGTDSVAAEQYDENGQLLNPQEMTGEMNEECEGNGENEQQLDQINEGGEMIQNQGGNNDEENEEQGGGELAINEEKGQQDIIAEIGDENPENRKNVLEMLDTDTESLKHEPSKISNDSDFDFSKS